MYHPRAVPVLRSPRSLMRDLRDRSAKVEVAVALALVLSICTLVAAMADWPLIA
jgi:hypothetical protein